MTSLEIADRMDVDVVNFQVTTREIVLVLDQEVRLPIVPDTIELSNEAVTKGYILARTSLFNELNNGYYSMDHRHFVPKVKEMNFYMSEIKRRGMDVPRLGLRGKSGYEAQ